MVPGEKAQNCTQSGRVSGIVSVVSESGRIGAHATEVIAVDIVDELDCPHVTIFAATNDTQAASMTRQVQRRS